MFGWGVWDETLGVVAHAPDAAEKNRAKRR